jgi:hypothetical protein
MHGRKLLTLSPVVLHACVPCFLPACGRKRIMPASLHLQAAAAWTTPQPIKKAGSPCFWATSLFVERLSELLPKGHDLAITLKFPRLAGVLRQPSLDVLLVYGKLCSCALHKLAQSHALKLGAVQVSHEPQDKGSFARGRWHKASQ